MRKEDHRGGTKTPLTSKKRARRSSRKSPGPAVTPRLVQAGHIVVVNAQEEEIRALDILELLMDISSRLQAIEH